MATQAADPHTCWKRPGRARASAQRAASGFMFYRAPYPGEQSVGVRRSGLSLQASESMGERLPTDATSDLHYTLSKAGALGMFKFERSFTPQ